MLRLFGEKSWVGPEPFLSYYYGYNVWETLSKGEPSPRKEILHNIDPTDDWTTFEDCYYYKSCQQAAIRVGDWKLLTGCPGNGSWVPPQESFYPIANPPNVYEYQQHLSF